MQKLILQGRGACPLCGSSDSIDHMPFSEIPVVRCQGCGFIHSSKVMTAEALDAYYSNNFGGTRHLQGQIVNARVNALVLSRVLEVDSSTRILDVGTGYGFLLKELRDRYGAEGVGVELSEQEAQYGNETLGLKIHTQNLAEVPLDEASFNLVIACEVIEHTLEPIEFLKQMKRFVAPGGRLVIFTDNFESKVVRELGAGWPKWIPHTHVSHFSPKSLTKAIKSAGCQVETVASFTPWEHAARNLKHKLTWKTTSVEDGFSLDRALDTEMSGTYAVFGLRRILNPLWTAATMRHDLEGAMMCVVASIQK